MRAIAMSDVVHHSTSQGTTSAMLSTHCNLRTKLRIDSTHTMYIQYMPCSCIRTVLYMKYKYLHLVAHAVAKLPRVFEHEHVTTAQTSIYEKIHVDVSAIVNLHTRASFSTDRIRSSSSSNTGA
jgi:hypothetical protein